MTAPGYNRYKAFAAEVHGSPDDDENPLSVSAFDSNVVSEDEQEGESNTDEQEEAMSYLPDSRDSPLVTDFDLNGPKESQQEAPAIVNDKEDQIPQDVQAEFLQWHHQLCHVSPKKIWMLAKLNILPSRLAHCNIPLCTSCLFGKATHRPWQHKAAKSHLMYMSIQTSAEIGIQMGAPDDPDTAWSRTGFIIEYAGCPLIWASKMQTLIALSSSEAEYIALSTSLREAIPLMELLHKIRDQGFDIKSSKPTVHCKVLEDNSRALEIATIHKVRPRTKHLNVQLHHFRQYVEQGDITIHKINTQDQEADILTKSLPVALFVKHRLAILGW